jgi:hypothetical protein
MTDNITLTRGATTVTIQTTSVSESYQKKLTIISPPTTGVTPKDTKIVDLLMIKHIISIEGAVDNLTDKSNLITMYRGKGVVSMTYANALVSPMNVIIEKLDIKETPTDEDTVSYYEVKLNVTEGVNLGT